jgi:hypothetical protein
MITLLIFMEPLLCWLLQCLCVCLFVCVCDYLSVCTAYICVFVDSVEKKKKRTIFRCCTELCVANPKTKVAVV